MAIEIRELIIKATVVSESGGAGGGSSASKEKKEALVQECVDQVMETLKEKEER